jgi:hypothetical protein
MADEDVVIGEVEADPIETPENPIVDFMKSVEDQKYTDAQKQFNDMINDRLQTQLDQARTKIAASIYGEEELDAAMSEVEDDEEIEDEDIEYDEEPEDEIELTDDEQDADDENVAGV